MDMTELWPRKEQLACVQPSTPERRGKALQEELQAGKQYKLYCSECLLCLVSSTDLLHTI